MKAYHVSPVIQEVAPARREINTSQAKKHFSKHQQQGSHQQT